LIVSFDKGEPSAHACRFDIKSLPADGALDGSLKGRGRRHPGSRAGAAA
jgi:hypothetical protein